MAWETEANGSQFKTNLVCAVSSRSAKGTVIPCLSITSKNKGEEKDTLSWGYSLVGRALAT